ncbi:Pentatricopeptide repeat-containing protein [Striga hermonthica]|uniref:Pentatricopeptide repeat-containing protein n=1 Tax=Striga hermonthica TaxID=68872 RepID=A0A9N7MHA4_STRHE|nr:Pentatricopeptide repeat-containing protein [Striga hermonthica]
MHSILRRTHVSSDQINAIIKSLAQQARFQEALHSYSISRFAFPSLLKSCVDSSHGEALHCAISKMGLHFDPYIATSLVRMYCKRGALPSAAKLFDEMSRRQDLVYDVALWNSIVDGCFKCGGFEEGMALFSRMRALNVKPDGYTLCILLGSCDYIFYGKEIHGYVVRNHFGDDPFVITAMIGMYSSFARPMDAWNVFENLSEIEQSIAAWNAMISCFSINGHCEICLEMYYSAKCKGLGIGSSTFTSVLTACSQGESLDFGRQLHCDVVKTGFERDSFVGTSLLTFYAKCGWIESAERVFCLARDGREVGLWNSMISAYVCSGRPDDALGLYIRKRREQIALDSFTLSNALVACTMIGSYCLAQLMHGELIKRPIKNNVAVQSALLTMYSKLGSVKDACEVFGQMEEKDIVAWGSMISGFCENKRFKEALYLYKIMKSDGLELDFGIVASVIIACVGNGDEQLGYCIHGLAIKEGLDLGAFTGSSLIEFYSKLGQPEIAKKVFSNVLRRNLALWNSLISCYCENGLPKVSLNLVPRILSDGLFLDSITMTSVLPAVSQMAALLKGKAIHCYHIKISHNREVQVQNALIDMYLKCGCFRYAQHVFDTMPKRDAVAWNTMISGYGSHGNCERAINLFVEMQDSGTPPDEITFLSLISSCNHNGFVSEGLNVFRSMREHKIEPKIEHYMNVVDLLGRAGCLEEAFNFIEKMAIAPDSSIWLSLLSACRVHKNIYIGELAANNLIKLEPGRGSNYIPLLNLYVDGGLKDKAANLRALLRQKGLLKVPGCSWIEMKSKVHVFFSGDSSSERIAEIYEILDNLRNSMRKRVCYFESAWRTHAPLSRPHMHPQQQTDAALVLPEQPGNPLRA